jgi:hypothetical protein
VRLRAEVAALNQLCGAPVAARALATRPHARAFAFLAMCANVRRVCARTPARVLVLALQAALLALLCSGGAHAQCSYELALPTAGTDVANGGGWCAPYASLPGMMAPTLCGGISVPPGAVLSFGTCALPGASCSGATSLTLLQADGLLPLRSVDRVALNSSLAALWLGCVLGARCSYGAWRVPACWTCHVWLLFRPAVAYHHACAALHLPAPAAACR